MTTGNAIKMSISVLCLVATAGAIYNVNSDVQPLKRQAEAVACPNGCAQMLALSRTPTLHSFTFQVEVNKAEQRSVECTRSLILFGDYSCNLVP